MSGKKTRKKRTGRNKDTGLANIITTALVWIMLAVILVVVVFFGKLGIDYLSRKWNGKDPFRIAVYHGNSNGNYDGLLLLEYSVSAEIIAVMTIPGDVMINVVGKRIEYRLESLPQLANLENKGDDYVLESISLATGRYFRKVMYTDDQLVKENEVSSFLIKELVKNVFSGNANYYENYQLISGISRIADSSIYVYNLDDYPAYEESVDIDGMALRHLNTLMVDTIFDDALSLAMPVRESFSLVIDNTTRFPGLAAGYARILSNDGFDVVGQTSSDMGLQKSEIIVSDEEAVSSENIEAILRVIKNADVTVGGEAASHRSDVLVRLGSDLIE